MPLALGSTLLLLDAPRAVSVALRLVIGTTVKCLAVYTLACAYTNLWLLYRLLHVIQQYTVYFWLVDCFQIKALSNLDYQSGCWNHDYGVTVFYVFDYCFGYRHTFYLYRQ